MFEEFGRDIFVDVILRRELDRDSHQVEGKHSHPTRAVALFEMAAVGKRVVAVEHADVIESEEPALEYILPLGVLAVHPPGERDQHLVENRFQDRKSTRLNSSHLVISYAVFCLKKKKK